MKNLLILLFLIIQVCGYSQNAQDLIDKLKVELKTKPDAKRTATIYSDLTWYYSNISVDSALVYGDKALEGSIKLKDSTLIAQVYSDVASVYFRKDNYKKAIFNYNKALLIRKLNKDFNGIAKINNNLGSAYLNTQEYTKALNLYISNLKYFESIKDFENYNVTKGNIGQLYIDLKSYDKAIKYLKEAIIYANSKKSDDRLCEYYLNLGLAYRTKNDIVNSVKCYDKGLIFCKKISNKKAIGNIYQNLTIISDLKKNDSTLNINLNNANKVLNNFNSSIDIANLKLTRVRILVKNKQYSNAKDTLLLIKKIFEKENSKQDLLYTYKFLIPVYAFLKLPDSVEYYNEKYSSLYEKILESEVIKQTLELETKYQTAKKEKLLIQKEAEAKKRNQLVLGLALFSVLIGFIGFLIYRQQKLKNQQQSQAFELKQAINQIETQNKLQSQRLAISKDLHDNIGAQLTFIISSVETAKFAPEIENTKLGNKLTKISDFTKDTIVELRDTIWAMNSNEISFEDLQIRISNFIEKASSASEDIAFDFNIDKNLNAIKLTSIIGMNIYRTIQEAINNALKYAKADKIAVNIFKVNDKINIEITDNGIGFDKETIVMGNGLQNMQKRIEEINGTFNIETDSENGTKILIGLGV